MLWLRRRCLADERFAKDANGKGVFAGHTVDEADRALLMGWQRRMVATFIAGMAFLLLLVIGAAISIPLESDVVRLSFWALILLLLVAATRVQFSAKCPRCKYRTGLQSRLVLPNACERCGVAFKRAFDP